MFFTKQTFTNSDGVEHTYTFTLLQHPTAIQPPVVVLKSFKATKDGKTLDSYDRNSPASFNTVDDREALRRAPTDVILNAVNDVRASIKAVFEDELNFK